MRFTVRRAVLAVAAPLLLASCAPTEDSDTTTTATTTATSVGEASAQVPAEAAASSARATGGNDGADGEVADAAVQDALTTLGTLEVKGRAPKTGYSRDEFGQRWRDTDRNGCDQRNDVLARDMTEVERQGPCKVTSGTLADPYTATTISFVRGQDTSSAVQIDHVVAMSDAWQKGAQQLSPVRREEFANDHLNLLAVDGPANMQKGDGDAATWLPANTPFRCSYVATQVQVKAKYDLWVTAAERDAIVRELGNCGGGDVDPVGEVPDEEAGEPEPVPAEPAGDGGGAGDGGADGGVYYENCTAARAAGAAPLYRGDPGYRARMDGDNDGVACEE